MGPPHPIFQNGRGLAGLSPDPPGAGPYCTQETRPCGLSIGPVPLPPIYANTSSNYVVAAPCAWVLAEVCAVGGGELMQMICKAGPGLAHCWGGAISCKLICGASHLHCYADAFPACPPGWRGWCEIRLVTPPPPKPGQGVGKLRHRVRERVGAVVSQPHPWADSPPQPLPRWPPPQSQLPPAETQ